MSESLQKTTDEGGDGDAEIWCSVRPYLPAAAFCTICRRSYSGRYLSVVADGRAACFRCVADQRLTTIERTNGKRDPAFRSGIFALLLAILTGGPRALTPAYRGPIWKALLFGAICSIFGTWFSMVRFLASSQGQELFQQTLERAQPPIAEEVLRAAFLWATPLVAVMRMAMGAILVHVMLRLWVGENTQPLRVHARLYAFTCASSLLLVLPGLWGALATNAIWCMASFNWIRQVYPTLPAWRLFLVIMPHILILGAA